MNQGCAESSHTADVCSLFWKTVLARSWLQAECWRLNEAHCSSLLSHTHTHPGFALSHMLLMCLARLEAPVTPAGLQWSLEGRCRIMRLRQLGVLADDWRSRRYEWGWMALLRSKLTLAFKHLKERKSFSTALEQKDSDQSIVDVDELHSGMSNASSFLICRFSPCSLRSWFFSYQTFFHRGSKYLVLFDYCISIYTVGQPIRCSTVLYA